MMGADEDGMIDLAGLLATAYHCVFVGAGSLRNGHVRDVETRFETSFEQPRRIAGGRGQRATVNYLSATSPN